MVTKPKKSKQKATQKIAISIRKPTLPKSRIFDQAVDFAQKKELKAEAEAEAEAKAESVGLVSPVALDSASKNLVSRKETDDKLTMTNAWTLMPKSVGEQKLLQRRAKNISRHELQSQADENEQYIRFRLGLSEIYGVPYAYIEEILPATIITRVPCTPAVIAGIVNYRGELLTVLDLRQIFGSKKSECEAEKSLIIVVKDGMLKVGLKVDEIEDNDEYVPANLAPPINNNSHISGIHGGKVAILEITSLLLDPALYIDNSVS